MFQTNLATFFSFPYFWYRGSESELISKPNSQIYFLILIRIGHNVDVFSNFHDYYSTLHFTDFVWSRIHPDIR